MPDYDTAVTCLQENIALLTDAYGKVSPDKQPIWNLTNAMLVIVDSLKRIDKQLSQK